MTTNNMLCNDQNESFCSILWAIRPSRGTVRFLIIFFLAAAHFAVDYISGLWNEYTDKATPERRNVFVDTGKLINEKLSIVSKTTAHLLDPSILIPDYPNQTDVSVVEHDIVLSSSSSKEEEEGLPLALCNPTAQVHISFSEPHWTLTTFDKHGNKKNVGGDEFYIVYRDYSLNETAEDPTAIALIQDYENGTYTLDFLMIPTQPIAPPKLFNGLGNLTVYFDYTCGIGSMAPPSKQHWMYTKPRIFPPFNQDQVMVDIMDV